MAKANQKDKAKFTVKDIAEMAGVSTATVSRVLNEKAIGNMRQETYERIKRIISATHYSPNPMAAALRSGATRVVGVILPNSINPYYAQLGKWIEDVAFKNGFLTLLCNSDSDVDREKAYINLLVAQRVSGILFCSTALTGEEISAIATNKLRVILLDEKLEDYDGNMVVGDDYTGGFKGAEYLHSLGHKNILIVTGPSHLSSNIARIGGIRQYCKMHDIDFNEWHVTRGEFTFESGYRAVSDALRSELRFTAVFALNDLMAFGAIGALRAAQVSVPNDVSVLGYDNVYIDEFLPPRLSSVATPFDRIANEAVNLVIRDRDTESINASDQNSRILVEPSIVIRETCIRLN